MKKDSFIENIKKEIEHKSEIKARLIKEISDIESEIDLLKDQIVNYTDVADVSTYTGMKDKLEILENKLELIRKNLKAEEQAPADNQIIADHGGFMSEKKSLEDKYGDEMIEIIRQLKKVYDESESKKGNLKALYDSWVQVFNIPSSYYSSYDPADSSGVSARVKQLLVSLEYLEKI